MLYRNETLCQMDSIVKIFCLTKKAALLARLFILVILNPPSVSGVGVFNNYFFKIFYGFRQSFFRRH